MSRPWFEDARNNPGAIHTLTSLVPAAPLRGPVSVPIGGPSTDEVWNGNGSDDTHTGTANADTLDGKGGNDTIHGGGQNDIITGGAGNDSLFGDDGNDTIHIGTDTDLVADGGNGDDTFIVDAAGGVINSIVGGIGFDIVDATALAANWQILAASGIEEWNLSNGSETFFGGSDNDIFHGNGGDDTLDGGGGNDTIDGGAGIDTLTGNTGNDTIDGGTENDLLSPGAGDDDVEGGDGFDTVYFTFASAAVDVNLKAGTATGEGTDTIAHVEGVVGSNFNDKITGSNGANNIVGGLGNDQLDGGKGIDTAYYTAAGNVTVNLDLGKSSGADGKDKIKAIENVVGFTGNDKLTGGAGTNQLFGDDGNDTLDGGAGDDFVFGEEGNDDLVGGNGTDVLTGGAGADSFIFGPIAAGNIADNFINDLENADTIDLSGIDANVNRADDQAFKIVASFHNKAGEATFAFNGVDQTFLQLDTDGDGVANFRIVIANDHDDFSNFVF